MLKIIAFFSVVAGALGAPNSLANELRQEGRIIGGTSTSIFNYPYQVSVEYYGSPICGGSIISSYFILTAAHCTLYSASGYTVRSGSSTRGSGGVVNNVVAITSHPRYNIKTNDYDIAVLRITKSFIFGSNMKAIALASAGSTPFPGASAVVTGWKTLDTNETSVPLQYSTVPIVSDAQCKSVYGSDTITPRMFCAGYSQDGRGVCTEDSGSPLVSGGVQVGIVSWGSGCGLTSSPSVYTSVGNLRMWITSATGI